MKENIPSVQAVFQSGLFVWYKANGRDLPWRKTRDPYAIWVSEIMLQQTQVNRVIGFFERFLVCFPTVFVLADASWEEVLPLWRGLGYYRRARLLHGAAKILVHDFGGKFPEKFEELKKLPGVGAYTAAAIASFAFGEDVPALDTNLQRVLGRVFGEKWSKLKPNARFVFAKNLILSVPGAGSPSGESPDSCLGLKSGNLDGVNSPFGRGGAAFNHAIMDIGATLCLPKQILCETCPLLAGCFIGQNPEKLVVAQKVKSLKKRTKGALQVAIGVIVRQGMVLICQRREGDSFGGYWEFPGGKIESGEDARGCLKRELQEELGIEVAVRPAYHQLEMEIFELSFAFSFHRCSILLGEPEAKEVAKFLWVKPEDLKHFTLTPGTEATLSTLFKKGRAFWWAT